MEVAWASDLPRREKVNLAGINLSVSLDTFQTQTQKDEDNCFSNHVEGLAGRLRLRWELHQLHLLYTNHWREKGHTAH